MLDEKLTEMYWSRQYLFNWNVLVSSIPFDWSKKKIGHAHSNAHTKKIATPTLTPITPAHIVVNMNVDISETIRKYERGY